MVILECLSPTNSYLSQPIQIYKPFIFVLYCVCVRQTLTTSQRCYCFLCLNFIQMSATGCHGLLWRILFALAQTNAQIQSFWGITELFTHSDFCSAHCTNVCKDAQMSMFILGYCPWLISDPQESVIWSFRLRLMYVYCLSSSDLKVTSIDLTLWHWIA